MSNIGDIVLSIHTYVLVVLSTDIYIVSFVVQDCVFEYSKADAIEERRNITDALYNVITTGKHAGSEWTMKVNAKSVPQQRKRCRTTRKRGGR